MIQNPAEKENRVISMYRRAVH